MFKRFCKSAFFAIIVALLTVNAAHATYNVAQATLGTVTSGVWNGTAIGATYGGTGQTSCTTGDILYASASNTWSKLSSGTSGYVLTSGGASTAPSWAAANPGFSSGSKQITTAGSPASGTAVAFASMTTSTDTEWNAQILVTIIWTDGGTHSSSIWGAEWRLTGKNRSGTGTTNQNVTNYSVLDPFFSVNNTWDATFSGTTLQLRATPTWTSGSPTVTVYYKVLSTSGTFTPVVTTL